MAKNPKPTFTARAYTDGSGYLVEAEWPDGVIRLVDDFGSESEAMEWITDKIGSASIQSRCSRRGPTACAPMT